MHARCPRCGYDQSGVIDSWKESCPLTGMCSECGLPIDWCRLLNERFRFEDEFFEHASQRRARAWWRTIRRTWRPRRFWRWVRMDHPVRRARLVRGALLGALFMDVLGVLGVGLVFFAITVIHRFTWSYWPIEELWYPVFRTLHYGLLPPGVALYFETPLAWVLLPPLTLVLMPAAFLTVPVTFRRAKVRRVHLLRIFLYGLAAYPLMCALPAWVIMLGEMVLELRPVLQLAWQLRPWIELAEWTLLIAWPVVFIGWWWYRAARDYLRLPRPGLIAIVLLAMAMAGSGVVIATAAILKPGMLLPQPVW